MVPLAECILVLAFVTTCFSLKTHGFGYVPECICSEDCPERLACIKQKCFDPCISRCGLNTKCEVIDHIPTCACLEGYVGDAFKECHPQISAQSTWPPINAGKKKFIIYQSQKTNWHAAYLTCLRNNSRLARLETKEENDEVLELIRCTGIRLDAFWLDATDLAEEGHWFWMSTGEPVFGFTGWQENQPDNWEGNENCMVMWERYEDKGYGWNDFPCTDNYYYICESYEL